MHMKKRWRALIDPPPLQRFSSTCYRPRNRLTTLACGITCLARLCFHSGNSCRVKQTDRKSRSQPLSPRLSFYFHRGGKHSAPAERQLSGLFFERPEVAGLRQRADQVGCRKTVAQDDPANESLTGYPVGCSGSPRAFRRPAQPATIVCRSAHPEPTQPRRRRH